MVLFIALISLFSALALTGYIVTKRHPERSKHSKAFGIAFAVLFVVLIVVLASGIFAGWRGG